MQRAARRRCQFHERLGAHLSHALVHEQRFVDAGGVGVGDAREDDGDDGGVLDGLGGALGEMREGRVAGVAEEGGAAVDPGTVERLLVCVLFPLSLSDMSMTYGSGWWTLSFHSTTSPSGTIFSIFCTFGQKSWKVCSICFLEPLV